MASTENVIDELLDDARERMTKSLESAHQEFSTVRTGRASPGLLDRIVVDYYGAITPLNQLATISAPEARLITVQPYDKSSIKEIEKSINESDVGLNPSNDGNLIRLAVPELTEERRHELVKVVRNLAEEGRVAIRNVRRDVMQHLRELKSEGEASSDDEHRAEVELQKLTDGKVAELDGVLKAKEEEILEVSGIGRPRRIRRATSRSSPTATAAGRAPTACPSTRVTAPAPTPSRRACATPPSWGSRS